MTKENFNDLYAFVCVAKAGSFTQAAAGLGVSQSALSQTVRNLERRLGVQLLTRTTRRLSLTAAGEQLFHSAEQGFACLENGLAVLKAAQDNLCNAKISG